jgi:type IX secretion system PorP/SprF family membrane protein
MKRKLLTLVMGVVAYCSFAQQTPQFTQYMYNTIAVNPGYAGSREALSIVGLHRSQWVGMDGGPVTQTLSIHSPLRNERIGVGFSFINDQLGDERNHYAYLDFAYTVNLSQNTKLAFGVKGGFSFYTLDESLLTDPDVINDPYFLEKYNRWTPNIGAGLYLHQPKWYVGISSPRLIENDYTKNGFYKALEQSHFYSIAGYVFDLNDSGSIKMRPTVLAKLTKGSPASFDGTLSFLFNEKLWLGASYRVDDSVGALADFQISKQLRLGYAYDYSISDVRRFNSGSHEIFLIFDFKFDKSKYKSPRYF